jgi:hypothetical protein
MSKPFTRRDSLDFRDKIYSPMLKPLADAWLPEKKHMVIRDQLNEGSCSGFGLKAVIDYLNSKKRIHEPVSARMLYEMAKRHDRWLGEDYEGSSARGAMKGWHKNGVCPEAIWEYAEGDPGYLTKERQEAALKNPLGAYYRILHRRSDIQAAINETGAIYVTADTHIGWSRNRIEDGLIPYKSSWVGRGGHAFAILGYTDEGFIIQNSWGEEWSHLEINGTIYKGCAIWQYEDFEDNLWDAWVARLALPVTSTRSLAGATYIDAGGRSEARPAGPAQYEIRDHYIHIDDGRFDRFGDYPSQEAHVGEAIDLAVGSGAGHIVLYAHGGLNTVKGSAMRVKAWRPAFERNKVHELHFIWETGMWEELCDVLLGKEDLTKNRVGTGITDWWDRCIERVTQRLGHAMWKEMQSDAAIAFDGDNRAGTTTLTMLIAKLGTLPPARRPKLHLVGHSAGSIWHAHLLDQWMKHGGFPIENLILFAPACTADLYNTLIYPAVESRTVKNLHHFLLDDETEQDDTVAGIYRKSLLYLVSRSYQERGEVVPIMGMEKYMKMLKSGSSRRFHAYNTRDNRNMTTSASHGGFDNDPATMNGILKLIVGSSAKPFKDEELEGY